MCQSDIFVHWNALSCAGVAEIYGLDQKAVCDRNLWIYGYVIVPRHHTTAIYCLINKGMVNIITGANIACILETDIFTAYQYGPHHAWYYLTSGLSNLVKSSQVTFIYIALLTIQIVTKHCTISK